MTLIKHKNGRYSVWSSIVDDFTYINMTRKEYINIRLNDYKEEIRRELENVDKGITHGIFFTLDERLDTIEKVHGKDRKEKVLKLLPKE